MTGGAEPPPEFAQSLNQLETEVDDTRSVVCCVW
jgi:hypothetical protein